MNNFDVDFVICMICKGIFSYKLFYVSFSFYFNVNRKKMMGDIKINLSLALCKSQLNIKSSVKVMYFIALPNYKSIRIKFNFPQWL